MNDEQYTPALGTWLKDTDIPSPDPQASARQIMTGLPEREKRRSWWPFHRQTTPVTSPTTDQTAQYQLAPIPATNGRSPTVTGRTQSMFSPAKAITAGALVFAIGSVLLIAQPFDQQGGSVPGAAQTEGEGTITSMLNLTCEAGQESSLGLPPCEFDEEFSRGSGFGRVLDEGEIYFTLVNPATTTGALEGMQVLDAAGVANIADGSTSGSGMVFWVGTVEGCGAGTFYAEAEFAFVGVQAYDAQSGNFVDVRDYSVNTFTIVPGGTLPITGTWDGSGTEVPNADGSRTNATTFTYSCEEASE